MADEELKIKITADDNASTILSKIGKTAKDALGTAVKVAAGVALGGITAFGAGLMTSVKAAMDSEKTAKQLEAVLKSTGGVAGVTAKQANDLANALSQITPFEDDAIISGENMLLTFTNIGKDVFPQATETMLNLSQAMGQDLKSSAIQLGKALNDPITGMSALSRVGVTFTEEQKAQIKALQESGDMMGAQKVILAELEREFGGAAKAAGDTFAGKLEILKNTFGNIQETIGGKFIPILTELATTLATVLNSPEVQAAIDGFFGEFQKLTKGDFTGIANDLSASWETALKPKLAEWASLFWTWLTEPGTGAIAQAAIQIANFTGSIQLAAGSPETQKQLQDIGRNIGRQIIDSIRALFADTNETDPVIKTLVTSLATSVGNLADSVAESGTAIGTGIIDGMVQGITGKQVPEWLGKALEWVLDETFNQMFGGAFKQFRNIGPLMNQGNGVSHFAEGGTVPGAIGQPQLAVVHGGETVIPYGRGMGASTVINLTLQYNPLISMADRYEAEQKLLPFIESALRRL